MPLNQKELEDLKARLNSFSKTKTKKESKDRRKIKLNKGDNLVRWLPYPDLTHPIIVMYFHYDIGKMKVLACPQANEGKECPICNLAFEMYNAGDKNLGKNLLAKSRYYIPVIRRDDPTNTVYFHDFGKGTSDELVVKYISKPDYAEACWDVHEGLDMTITKITKEETGKSFDTHEISFARKLTPLADSEEKIQEILASIPKLEDCHYPPLPASELEKILNEWLHPDEPDTKEEKPKIASLAQEKKVVLDENSAESKSETPVDWKATLDKVMADVENNLTKGTNK